MRQLTHRIDHGPFTCFALRGAESDPTLALADLMLPPNGDEAKRPEAERDITPSCELTRSHSHPLLPQSRHRGQSTILEFPRLPASQSR